MWSLLQNSTFSSSHFALGLGLAGVFSILLWWLIRRRVREIMLPILRIIKSSPYKLPRIIFTKPPLIAFLAFLGSLLVFGTWAMKPSLRIFSDFESGKSQVHVYVDMSPSVMSQTVLTDLSQKVAHLFDEFSQKSKMTLGTSHGNTVYEIANGVSAGELISGLSFHKAGVKIGSSLRSQLSRIGDVDLVLIVSDRDQYSWSGFEWQHLETDTVVRFVDLDASNQKSPKPNLFFQDIRNISSLSSLTSDWEVVIGEGAFTGPATGTIHASLDGDPLVTSKWEIKGGERSTTVVVSWPAKKLGQQSSTKSIDWSLEVEGGDQLVLDNRFKTPFFTEQGEILLIGESHGELSLDDPLHQMTLALRAAGYFVRRKEYYDHHQPARTEAVREDPNLAIVSTSTDKDSWCPFLGKNQKGIYEHTWYLMNANTNWSDLCECMTHAEDWGVSEFTCSQNMTKETFFSLLIKSGALPVAHRLLGTQSPLGLRILEKNTGHSAIVFFRDIQPNFQGALNWGVYPIVIKDLVQATLQRQSMEASTAGKWPRISDLSSLGSSSTDGSSSTRWIRETNVPVGESMLSMMPLGELPETYAGSSLLSGKRLPSKRDREDPWPWLKLLACSMVLLSVLEVLWMIIAKIKGYTKWEVLVLLIALGGPCWSQTGHAQIKLNYLTDKDLGQTFQDLSKEVSSRTSIELSRLMNTLKQFDADLIDSPWLWVHQISKITAKDGTLLPRARMWLKHGGMFILEGVKSDQELTQLTKNLDGVFKGEWIPVSADHEMMRSFYLLNSLPTCQGRQWKLFHYDGRVAMIAAPYSILSFLQDRPLTWNCDGNFPFEMHARQFVNLMMMVLTTDYKKDQIHLPEILKRLRTP